jgi:hypothetical protein
MREYSVAKVLENERTPEAENVESIDKGAVDLSSGQNVDTVRKKMDRVKTNRKWSKVFNICPGCNTKHQTSKQLCTKCEMSGKHHRNKRDWSGELHRCPKCVNSHTGKFRICEKCRKHIKDLCRARVLRKSIKPDKS